MAVDGRANDAAVAGASPASTKRKAGVLDMATPKPKKITHQAQEPPAVASPARGARKAVPAAPSVTDAAPEAARNAASTAKAGASKATAVKATAQKAAIPSAAGHDRSAVGGVSQANQAVERNAAVRAKVEADMAAQEAAVAVETLSPGVFVRLFGLQASPQLNGITGSLRQYDSGKERWLVDCKDGTARRVRPTHLKAVSKDEEADEEEIEVEVELASTVLPASASAGGVSVEAQPAPNGLSEASSSSSSSSSSSDSDAEEASAVGTSNVGGFASAVSGATAPSAPSIADLAPAASSSKPDSQREQQQDAEHSDSSDSECSNSSSSSSSGDQTALHAGTPRKPANRKFDDGDSLLALLGDDPTPSTASAIPAVSAVLSLSAANPILLAAARATVDARGDLKSHGNKASANVQATDADGRSIPLPCQLSPPTRSCLGRRKAILNTSGRKLKFCHKLVYPSAEITNFKFDDLWYTNPGQSIACTYCEGEFEQADGKLVGAPGRSQFAQCDFVCHTCFMADDGVDE